MDNHVSGLGSLTFQQPENREEKKIDPIDELPTELSLKIFSDLNGAQLGRCLQVTKRWQVLASDETLWNALPPRVAFGKKQWEAYF